MNTATVEKHTSRESEARSSRWRRIFLPKQKGTLLDTVMPVYDFRGTVSEVMHATPHQIFRAMNEVTLADMPVAYALGTLRYLPGRLMGRLHDDVGKDQPFFEQLKAGGTVVLAEQRGREIVLGSIGKYHQLLDQQWVPLHRPKEFVRFHDPEYQKLAMAIRVEGRSAGDGYTVTLEHRTYALSPKARRKFGWYWFVIKPTGNFVGWVLLRAIRRRAERLRTSHSD